MQTIILDNFSNLFVALSKYGDCPFQLNICIWDSRQLNHVTIGHQTIFRVLLMLRSHHLFRGSSLSTSLCFSWSSSSLIIAALRTASALFFSSTHLSSKHAWHRAVTAPYQVCQCSVGKSVSQRLIGAHIILAAFNHHSRTARG